jgi:hypothetical protein
MLVAPGASDFQAGPLHSGVTVPSFSFPTLHPSRRNFNHQTTITTLRFINPDDHQHRGLRPKAQPSKGDVHPTQRQDLFSLETAFLRAQRG